MFGWKVIPRIGFGPLQISPHGVGIAFGVFVGAWLMARRARARGYDENHAWNTAAWGVVGAIIGARAAYVIGHIDAFSSPLQWLEIWKGGISLVGGLLGGIILAALYFRRHGLDFWELADLGAPALALGIALGRSGDLVIGDHLGKPTHFFLGWVYKGGELISRPPCLTQSGRPVYPTPDGCIIPGLKVHQTALYDALWCLVIFAILVWMERRPRPRGLLFLSWAGLYAAGRIVTDFLRVDKRWILGLTGSQITSILAVALCGYLILRYHGAPPRRAKPPPPDAEPVAAAAEADHAAEAPPDAASDEAAVPTEAGVPAEEAAEPPGPRTSG
jgi:prolipoprotein diacylglyceryl transferase